VILNNPDVGSNRSKFRAVDYAKINIFGFGTTALFSSLDDIILPLLLLGFVPESRKDTYLGLLTLIGLGLAMVVQPIAGALSDRYRFSWGRRRPYVLLGSIIMLGLLPVIHFANSLPMLMLLYYALLVGGNIALGPYQALIPDLVPEANRGVASGVRGIFLISGGVIAIYMTGHLMGHYAAGQAVSWLLLSLGIVGAILLGTLLVTLVAVKEQSGDQEGKLALVAILRNTFKIDVKANPDYVRFLLSRLFYIIPLTAFQVFGLYFFRDVAGVADPAAVMGNFTLVSGGAMLAAAYPAGWLSDKIGRRRVALTSGLVGASGITLLFFFHQYHFMLFASALMGIGFGGLTSANWTQAVDLAPEAEAGKYMSLTNLATAGGSALARVNGPMIDYFNARRPELGYSAMLLTSLVSLITSALLSWTIRKKNSHLGT
jgi:Na+/melibiose symporter-like transporter